jgi:hypothetical protein
LAQRVSADFGEELPQLLRKWVSSITLVDAPLVDISAGEWRRHVCAHEQDWPAAMPAWERLKFLAHARSGSGRLMLKFAGLGSIGERKLGMARALHSAGLTAKPFGLLHGFLVERWCEGKPLGRDEKPIAEVAHYIATRARLFPANADSGATLERLFEMSRRNIGLALEDVSAKLLDRWSSRLDVLSRRVVRVRTDNKLDRHEWLHSPDGRLLKTDALDHHAAHDLIGCQDMAWDIGGAIVEFELNAREADGLIATAERISGRHVDHELLEFCLLAYLAFRIGQASFAAQICAFDASEAARLKAAADRYGTELKALLLQSSSASNWLESSVD